MAVTVCDSGDGGPANLAILALLAVAVLLVVYMVRKRCGLKDGGPESMVGDHWGHAGTYGHTGATLPAYSLSGYYPSIPTPSWA